MANVNYDNTTSVVKPELYPSAIVARYRGRHSGRVVCRKSVLPLGGGQPAGHCCWSRSGDGHCSQAYIVQRIHVSGHWQQCQSRRHRTGQVSSRAILLTPLNSYSSLIQFNFTAVNFCLQCFGLECFDTVGWASGRASGL